MDTDGCFVVGEHEPGGLEANHLEDVLDDVRQIVVEQWFNLEFSENPYNWTKLVYIIKRSSLLSFTG